MFGDNNLKTHLQNSSTIELSSLVYAEINMNDPDNIAKIGNYRNRDSEIIQPIYLEENGETANPYYYGYTDSDILVDGGYDDTENPTRLMSTQEKVKLYYSLEDCFRQFRPRSGINKASFYSRKNTHFLHNDAGYMMARPRYYLADKNDTFKYWSSFRYQVSGTTPTNMTMVARGISKKSTGNVSENEYSIDDAAPFIVYKEAVPINRVVIKIQTHVGTVTDQTATYYNSDSEFIDDPLYEEENVVLNRIVPVNWEVQYLDDSNNWVTLKYFDSAYASEDNPLIGRDGYLELQFDNGEWIVGSNSITAETPMLSTFTDASLEGTEYLMVNGIRLVVNSISRRDFPFELIELSSRLAINLTDMTKGYSIKKVAANLGSTSIPVGQLLASTGQINLADYDLAFSLENQNSIIAQRLQRNMQFKFFEIIKDVAYGETQSNVYVPIKTMYADVFPMVDSKSREVSIDLRDLFVQFESLTTPEIFLKDVSFSYAVAMVLDSIGFTNYIYKKSPNDTEPIIQDFFVEPNSSVAQVLQDLAVSTQTAMFFDEYNNLVLMSKSYMLPGIGDRPTDTPDLILRGSNTGSALANIIDIQSQDQDIYNSGKVAYTERYIQRTMREIRQASLLDSDQTWIYKPVVLWEVSPTENTKAHNGEINNQSAYSLSAIPLHTDLTDEVPYVDESNQIRKNIMNLGEGVYWITRYNGYFYANGEIIRYDAVEYSVQGVGNVWINSAEEYGEYFARVAFNGKIFPTGRVRIFVEPFYLANGSTPKPGVVARHGRGQFNTKIAYHNAGISNDKFGNAHWTRDDANVNGVTMDSRYLFDSTLNLPTVVDAATGKDFTSAKKSQALARHSKRVGKIRNFLSSSYFAEDDPNSPQAKSTATMQSSALVFSGPAFSTAEDSKDFLSYVYKSNLAAETLGKPNHYGTRLRLLGQPTADSAIQIPSGAYSMKQINDTKVSANSAGIAILGVKENTGYFLEIAALSNVNMEQYAENEESIYNIVLYKTMSKSGDTSDKKAIPVILWYGRANILVDDGKFTGQYRMAKEENPTVYDIAIEYKTDVQPKDNDNGNNSGLTFSIYLNNKLIGTVTDTQKPLNLTDKAALFVRGSTTAMFENMYALKNNASANYFNPSETPLTAVSSFSKEEAIEESYRKYELPRAVSETYLTGISATAPKKHNLWFEEFGTIMREMDYFNIKYDKAYPALAAKIAPTFNAMKGYAVSGFNPTAYGAEFMVFNITDKAVNLDETSGNWLRILGVTFTQQTERDLTLEEYFAENANLSDPSYWKGAASGNIILNEKNYQRIKNSIAKYGKKEFSVDALYIQNKAIAEKTMKFLIRNMTVPKKAVGVEIFGAPNLQLGDIVSFNYKTSDNIDVIADPATRFVVYSINHSRDGDGLKTTVYVSEVLD